MNNENYNKFMEYLKQLREKIDNNALNNIFIDFSDLPEDYEKYSTKYFTINCNCGKIAVFLNPKNHNCLCSNCLKKKWRIQHLEKCLHVAIYEKIEKLKGE